MELRNAASAMAGLGMVAAVGAGCRPELNREVFEDAGDVSADVCSLGYQAAHPDPEKPDMTENLRLSLNDTKPILDSRAIDEETGEVSGSVLFEIYAYLAKEDGAPVDKETLDTLVQKSLVFVATSTSDFRDAGTSSTWNTHVDDCGDGSEKNQMCVHAPFFEDDLLEDDLKICITALWGCEEIAPIDGKQSACAGLTENMMLDNDGYR